MVVCYFCSSLLRDSDFGHSAPISPHDTPQGGLYSFRSVGPALQMLAQQYTSILPCKAKRQYLLTLQVSRYRLLPLQSSIGSHCCMTPGYCHYTQAMLTKPVIQAAEITVAQYTWRAANGEIVLYKPWKPRSLFPFEIIINVLVSSFRFIWIPMLWVS